MRGAHDWGTSVDLSESERHRALASDRRRHALAVLGGTNPPTDLRPLAAAVARREAHGGAPTPAAVDRVRISLYHRHLPLLDDLGIVEFDPGAKRVEAGVPDR